MDYFTILKTPYPTGQPARLEENFAINLKTSTEMAPGRSRPCRSPRRNPSPIDPIEDEFARNPGSARGPHLGSTSPALSCNPTLGPDLVPALVLALIPAPVFTDELFKKFMKAYLEMNQGPRQSPAERKQTFKAKVSEMYYGKLHMNCYHFCQQYKDHFKTAGATGFNQTSFAASFLFRNISMHWA